MTLLNEAVKEEDYYYQGAFWIKANSVRDIHSGNFELIGSKLVCDYNGNYVDSVDTKKLTHEQIWPDFNNGYEDEPYNYLPRGRVGIYKGEAFIHLNSKMNIPEVIDAIINMYQIKKLKVTVKLNDTYQGSHYDFLLQ